MRDEVLNKSLELAYASLDNFFKNIGLEKELFEHLYNIEIIIKEGYSSLEYDYENNIIIIDEDYYNLIKTTYLDNEEKAIKNLAENLIHEIIHADRTILTNQGLSSEAILSTLLKENEVEKPKMASDIYKIDDKINELNGEDKINYMDNVLDTIENQHNLEEAVTEALATLILLTRNKEELDLELVKDNILNNPYDKDVKEGIKILAELGVDNIRKWFIAPYLEEYNDILLDFYKDDYIKKAQDISEIYKSTRF